MADISITAANVLRVSGNVSRGTAGDTITAGMPLYKDSTDSDSLKPADHDAEASAACVGIALHGASDGQPIEYLLPGTDATASVINMGATLTVGEIYVVSTNAGGVAPEGDLGSNDYVTVLGVAKTAANLEFRPVVSGAQVP